MVFHAIFHQQRSSRTTQCMATEPPPFEIDVRFPGHPSNGCAEAAPPRYRTERIVSGQEDIAIGDIRSLVLDVVKQNVPDALRQWEHALIAALRGGDRYRILRPIDIVKQQGT